jgi:hypothetical protein
LQIEPQLISGVDSPLFTVPLPDLVTFKLYFVVAGAFFVNVAVAVAALLETLHVLDVPEHAPDHFVNVEPEAGVAVSVIDVTEVL